jgi:hypothetical protein
MHFNSFTVTLNGFPPVVPSNPDKVYKNKGWVNRGRFPRNSYGIL